MKNQTGVEPFEQEAVKGAEPFELILGKMMGRNKTTHPPTPATTYYAHIIDSNKVRLWILIDPRSGIY